MKKSIILTLLASAVTLSAIAQSQRKPATADAAAAKSEAAAPPTVRGGRDIKRVAHPTGKGEGAIPYGTPIPRASKPAAIPATAADDKRSTSQSSTSAMQDTRRPEMVP